MRYLVLGLVALALGLAIGRAVWDHDDARFEARAQLAEAHAQAMRAVADSATERAAGAEQRARAWQDSANLRRGRIVERIRYVRDVMPPAPDTCAPWVAARDSIIGDMERESLELRLALAEQEIATEDLHVAVSALRSANDSLSAVLAARPRPKLPVTIGAFGGYCIDGRPCVGAGVVVPVDLGALVRRIF